MGKNKKKNFDDELSSDSSDSDKEEKVEKKTDKKKDNSDIDQVLMMNNKLIY